MYPQHNKQSPKRAMKKLEPRSLKSPSSKSKKTYRNALFLPKSKEPTGFCSSSHRFGPKAAYEPPETKDYFEKKPTLITLNRREDRLLTLVLDDQKMSVMGTTTYFEERQDPDRNNIPVRTAQTVSTARNIVNIATQGLWSKSF